MEYVSDIIRDIVFLLVILAFIAFTGWVFFLTRNPWSFAILVMLSGFSMEKNSDKRKKK